MSGIHVVKVGWRDKAMQASSNKQFEHDAQYWVEVRHQDHCAFCKDAVRNDCARAPKDAPKRRTRVAQLPVAEFKLHA